MGSDTFVARVSKSVPWLVVAVVVLGASFAADAGAASDTESPKVESTASGAIAQGGVIDESPRRSTALQSAMTSTGSDGSDSIVHTLGLSGGSFTPAPNGAATYRIPIVVPPGTAGLQPSLALVYASQGLTGLIGVGWSLDGLPAITRCGATFAQDGFSGGVKLDANDRFCVGGQRLMVIKGTYGADGAEYRTEVDSFVRVVSYGAAGAGPASFRGWNKAGQIMEFGATADSRIEAEGRTSVLVWAVNKVQDASGNYFAVSYVEDAASGEFRPVRIDYTGNAAGGLAPTRSVTFEYDARPDQPRKYVGGSLLRWTKRLTRIKTWVQTTLVRDYRLAYATTAPRDRSRLISVTECDRNGACLPPKVFGWRVPGTGALTTPPTTLPWNGSTAETFTGDVNGDGIADAIQIRKTVATAKVLLSQGNGTFQEVTGAIPDALVWRTEIAKTYLLDVNGDGRLDILQIKIDGHQARVLLGSATGTYTVSPWNPPTDGSVVWRSDSATSQTLVGDVNGDGRADIVQIRTDQHKARVLLGNGDGTFTVASWTPPTDGSVLWGTSQISFLRDVNGDGRADIVQVRTDQHKARVLLSNGDGSYALSSWNPPTNGTVVWWAQEAQTIVEDVNGDGLADIIQVRTDHPMGRVLLSKGDGTFDVAWTSPSDGTVFWAASNALTYVGDVNGDGRADLVQVRTVTQHQGRTLLSVGDGTFVVGWTSPASGDGFLWGPGTKTYIEDFNGDGLADLLQNRSDVNTASVALSSGPVPDLLTSVTTPLGGQLTIAYRPATDPTVHVRDTGSVYPLVDRPAPVHVVSGASTSDGRGTTSTLSYGYGGLKFQLLGRGGLGFRWRRVTEDASGVETTTFFRQDFPFTGLVDSSEVRDAADALQLQTANTWTVVETNPGKRTFFPRLDQADTFECDGQAVCRELSRSFEYDAHGNLTRTLHWGDVATTGDERDEYTDWIVDTVAWLHRPSRVVVFGAGAALLRERWISYDNGAWGTLGARGLPTREESRLAGGRGAPGNPVVVRAHDAYGNPLQETDPRGCAVTTVFETTHQTYPQAVKTCLVHTTTFTHDPRFGVRLTETDPNAQKTTFSYDDLGRLTRVTGPLDAGSTYGTVTKAYLDVGNPALQRIVTYRTEQHGTANVVWSEEVFDGLGRIYGTRIEGPNGQTIVTDTVFDRRGLVSRTSAPRFAAEAAAWTDFAYDALGRRTRLTRPDAFFATTVHAPGLVTTTDERGKVTRRHIDAFGRVTRVDEVNDGATYSTRYVYDATGALKTVTDHLGRVTSIAYDSLGRKIGLTDPNTGTWSYRYDPSGLLTSQTDARNQTVTFVYDAQGRVRFKRYPGGGQIEWTWDDPGVPYGKGRLARVVDLATNTTFRYDPLGRVVQTQRLLDGTTYTLSRTWDALGRVASETFPDGDTVSYGFNAAGWLDRVGNGLNPTAYVQSITWNARGQRTSVRSANGVTSTLTYYDGAADAKSFRLKKIVTTGPGGPLQNLTYLYDPIGQVTAITDAVGTGTRSFTYDALRRVVSASGAFGSNQAAITETYGYDAVGNILSKAGVAYLYSDPVHPGAVTGRSDGTTYTYDANGNILNGGGRALAWDPDNRLAAVTMQGGNSAEFVYDDAGRRVRKTVNAAAVTRYPFAGYEVDTTGVITKLFAGVGRKSSGQTLFYHDDHLGSVHVVTDQTGFRVQLTEYDPWGRISRSEGTADRTHAFTGQFLDPETGLMYYGGRYYDQVLGRFLSPDPFVPEPGGPQLLNRYTYVANNPVNGVDPSGHILGLFLGAAFLHSKIVSAMGSKAVAVDRVVSPIVMGIAAGAAMTAGTGGCVPCGAVVGAAAAGTYGAMLGVFYDGGGAGDAVLAGLIGSAIGGASGAAGMGVGVAAGGGFTGAVLGGVVGGATGGAMHATIYGGNVLESAGYGAVLSAVSAAAFYGGYQLYGALSPPEIHAAPCTSECIEVTPGGRRLRGVEKWLFAPYHKFYRVVDGDATAYSEISFDSERNIRVHTGEPGPDLTKETTAALGSRSVVWGKTSIISRSALTTSQGLYALEGQPYRWYSHNSNWYVNSVLRGAGADPTVRGIWAPAFGR